MISDKTIDESTAKYWCIFSNKGFKHALDKVVSEIASSKTQQIAQNALEDGIKSKAQDAQLNESFTDFLANLSPSDPASGSVGIVGDLADKTPEQIKANAAAMGTAAVSAAAILTPPGRTAASAVGKTIVKNPGKALLAGATVKLGMDMAGDENDAWWDKLGKLVNKVWDIGAFTAKHSTAIAVAGTTAFALFKTAPLWMPLISSMVKSMLRGDSLAVVEFDSNGTMYKMHYDMKYRRWELMYKGFSFGRSPAPEETEQLMNTAFFKHYIQQCKDYIIPIIKNEDREAVMQAIAALSSNKSQKVIEKIMYDKSIIDNMFALKYKY